MRNDEMTLNEARQIARRGKELFRAFERLDEALEIQERAERETQTLEATILTHRRTVADLTAAITERQTEIEGLGAFAKELRSATEAEHANQVATLRRDYEQAEAREKALHQERLEAMHRSYDEAHAARQVQAEQVIAEAGRVEALAIGQRDRALEAVDALKAEIAGLVREKAEAQGELARVQEGLRGLLGTVKGVVPPDPDER